MGSFSKMLLLASSLFASCVLSAPSQRSTVAVGSQQLVKRATGTCDSPEFVAEVPVGGTGTNFCASNWGGSYLPIESLTIWDNENYVTGILATFSDQTTSGMIGNTASRQQTIGVNYGSNDLWSRITLYGGEGDASFVRHLLIENTAGDEVNAGIALANNPSPPTAHTQPVGAGILYGLQGTTGNNGELTSLGFLLLDSAIAAIDVSNVQFPSGPVGTGDGIQPTTLATGHYYNDGSDSEEQWQFNNQVTETQSYEFQQAIANAFAIAEGIMFGASFNLLIVTVMASSTTTFTWTTTTTDTTSTTITQAIQVQYNAQGDIAPGQGVDCVAIAGQGSGTFPYTSTVTITLKNGNSYTFAEDGELTVSAISQANVQVTAANHP